MVGPSYPFRGGISHYTTLLYRHLRKRHDVAFFTFTRQYPSFLFPGKTDKDPSSEALREPGSHSCLDSMNPLTWIGTAIRIIRYKPDMLILPWWVVFWAPHFVVISTLVKVFSKLRILFLCHNVVEHEAGWGKKTVAKMVLAFGDAYLVHSSQEKDRLKAIVGHEKSIITAFHPLYDVFGSAVVSRDEARRMLEIGDRNVIMFFGFVREYKGLRFLLKALPLVERRFAPRLLVVGEFWDDKQPYLDLISTLGIADKVTIIDRYVPNEEIGVFFAAADAVAVPYTSVTGSGLVQMALGFDKPLIVTDVGALAEIIRHGETGYVVPPRDPRAIAGAINDFFATDSAERMSDNVLHEKRRFSWDALVAAIEKGGVRP